MNRRGFLAAIPGLALLSKLRGKKKEAPPDLYDKVMPAWDDDKAERINRHLDAVRRHLDLAANPMFIVNNGEPGVSWRVIRPGSIYGDGRSWYTDPTGAIRTSPGYRGPVDFKCRPTFAELSRQWDATT